MFISGCEQCTVCANVVRVRVCVSATVTCRSGVPATSLRMSLISYVWTADTLISYTAASLQHRASQAASSNIYHTTCTKRRIGRITKKNTHTHTRNSSTQDDGVINYCFVVSGTSN